MVFCLTFPVFSQLNSAELLFEITYEKAKYSKFAEEGDVMGPSSIDIDLNGDIYIASGQRILVYDKSGNYLKTIKFDERLQEIANDIALSLNDKLYILTKRQTIYIINKDVTDISKGNIDKRIFIRTGYGLNKIWLTKDDQCLVSWKANKYHVIDENDLIYNEVNSKYVGIPGYSTSLSEEFSGMPLKWSNKTISKGWENKGVLNLDLNEVRKTPSSKTSKNVVDLYSKIPDIKKEKYSKISIAEVFGFETHQNLFVKVYAQLKNEFFPGTRMHRSKELIFVINKSGEYLNLIEDIPIKDRISKVTYDGNRFAVGSKGRLYFINTTGGREIKSFVTQVYRW